MSDLSEAAQEVYGEIFEFAGENVTYAPVDGAAAVEIQAIRGNCIADTFGEPGKRVIARGMSFGIYAEELGRKPVKLDRITDALGRRYDVVERGGKAMEYNDPYQILMRVNVIER